MYFGSGPQGAWPRDNASTQLSLLLRKGSEVLEREDGGEGDATQLFGELVLLDEMEDGVC